MTNPQAGSTWGPQQRERERELLTRLHELPADDSRIIAVRDELVTMHLPLVRHIARRYGERGEPFDDLVQVGTVGLIHAVDRFDLERGVEFSTYATPLILGEIKRHFRDRTWAVRMPRRLQELSASTTAATDALTLELGRSPTIREVAERSGCSVDDVLQAREARQALAADSIDAGDADDLGTVATLGMDDVDLEAVVNREAVRALLQRLPDREREVVILRFFKQLSQSQIAEQLGVSQMQVSRILARSLAHLRDDMSIEAT